MNIRILLITVWLAVITAGISFLFWEQDWQYSLPTPVPKNYTEVKTGTQVHLPVTIAGSDGKPVFIHFYNPECPCSRFNIPQFRALVRQYSSRMTFAIVTFNTKEKYSTEEIRNQFGISQLPVFFLKSIADACGVYSTPQAVILQKDGRLFYRGNYNQSRYCINRNTDYAKMAIDSLFGSCRRPNLPESAFRSYGCSLPQCSK